MIGWAFRLFAIFGGIALLLYVLVVRQPALLVLIGGSFPHFVLIGGWLPHQEPVFDAGARIRPATPPHATGAMPNSLVYRANSQGHVVLDGVVNGAPVRFLVDTGATMVVLTMHDAAAAGITRGDLNFTMRTSTANGIARAAPVRLREVRVGQLSIEEVPAAVAENLGISLLGQSFLTRLDSYEMRDGVLTLSYW